jgi:hypothetical protein
VKPGDCTKKLILDVDFLIFGLNVVSISRCLVFNLAGFFSNEMVMLLLVKLRVHDLS